MRISDWSSDVFSSYLIPHHFQFDLGVTAKLNRLVMWQRGAFDQQSLLFNSGNLRKWEIWGSSEPADIGSYDGWTPLLSCASVKPSGLPKGKKNSEDRKSTRLNSSN